MSFLNRIQDILGVADELPPYDDYPLEPDHPSNVVEMPGMAGIQAELVVMEPRSFEAVPEAILALRDRKAVILNLNHMDTDEAQRSVDYVAGGVFAMDGHQERINQNVFLFTPASVQISSYAGSTFDTPPAPQSGLGFSGETEEQRMLKRLNLKTPEVSSSLSNSAAPANAPFSQPGHPPAGPAAY